jgi:hypothetical protein
LFTRIDNDCVVANASAGIFATMGALRPPSPVGTQRNDIALRAKKLNKLLQPSANGSLPADSSAICDQLTRVMLASDARTQIHFIDMVAIENVVSRYALALKDGRLDRPGRLSKTTAIHGYCKCHNLARPSA